MVRQFFTLSFGFFWLAVLHLWGPWPPAQNPGTIIDISALWWGYIASSSAYAAVMLPVMWFFPRRPFTKMTFLAYELCVFTFAGIIYVLTGLVYLPIALTMFVLARKYPSLRGKGTANQLIYWLESPVRSFLAAHRATFKDTRAVRCRLGQVARTSLLQRRRHPLWDIVIVLSVSFLFKMPGDFGDRGLYESVWLGCVIAAVLALPFPRRVEYSVRCLAAKLGLVRMAPRHTLRHTLPLGVYVLKAAFGLVYLASLLVSSLLTVGARVGIELFAWYLKTTKSAWPVRDNLAHFWDHPNPVRSASRHPKLRFVLRYASLLPRFLVELWLFPQWVAEEALTLHLRHQWKMEKLRATQAPLRTDGVALDLCIAELSEKKRLLSVHDSDWLRVKVELERVCNKRAAIKLHKLTSEPLLHCEAWIWQFQARAA